MFKEEEKETVVYNRSLVGQSIDVGATPKKNSGRSLTGAQERTLFPSCNILTLRPIFLTTSWTKVDRASMVHGLEVRVPLL